MKYHILARNWKSPTQRQVTILLWTCYTTHQVPSQAWRFTKAERRSGCDSSRHIGWCLSMWVSKRLSFYETEWKQWCNTIQTCCVVTQVSRIWEQNYDRLGEKLKCGTGNDISLNYHFRIPLKSLWLSFSIRKVFNLGQISVTSVACVHNQDRDWKTGLFSMIYSREHPLRFWEVQ